MCIVKIKQISIILEGEIMKKTSNTLAAVNIAVLSILSCFWNAEVKADQIDDVRNILKEWVSVEKTISQELETWKQERKLLEGVITSLDQEERVLRNTIEVAEKASNRADNERIELFARRNTYQQNAERFGNQLVLYERQVVRLIPRLPIVLRDEIGLMTNKLYLAETGNYSLSERAQTLISLLSSIQEFDSSITVTNEIRTIGSDEEIEVKVLYIGLARAFYADQANRVAGMGRPVHGGSEAGWQWIEQVDLAKDINRAIDIYENSDAPSLIRLPFSVQMN